jgi:GNAT superfamily N-acetyltransferase
VFQLFEEKWTQAVWQYCDHNPLETLEIRYYLNMTIEKTSKLGKRDGHLYILVENSAVQGLAFFNLKGVMYISFASDTIFKKVDFLKAIHKEQPSMIRGERHQVEKVFVLLQRVLKDFSFYPFHMMVYEHCLDTLDIQAVDRESIIPAHSVDWLTHGKFLLEVEAHFRSHTTTINNLRHKIHKREDFDYYCVYSKDGQILGQLICEFSINDYVIIGGVFVRLKERNKGIAKKLMLEGMRYIKEQHKKPTLYVGAKNSSAIELYEKMGFVKKMDLMNLTIKL